MAIDINRLEKTISILDSFKKLDPNVIVTEKGLEKRKNISEAIRSIFSIKDCTAAITREVIESTPETHFNIFSTTVEETYNTIQNLRSYDEDNQNIQLTNIIGSITRKYDDLFKYAQPYIIVAQLRHNTEILKQREKLERENAQYFFEFKDKSDKLFNEIMNNQSESKKILQDVKDVAAQHSVTQQSIYFKDEADIHNREAAKWKKETSNVVTLIVLASILALAASIYGWFKTDNPYDAIQLAASKILIFGALSYYLHLSARNFLSHKHNSVVNKHRQNALSTYQTIIDASNTTQNKEIILNHAANAIFSQQPTGYIPSLPVPEPSTDSIINLVDKFDRTKG